VSAISTYKLYDKFRFEAEAYALGGIKAFDFNTGENVNLDAALDLNFKAEYLVSKQFSAFVRLNNLLSNEYEVLYNYPSRGFQVMAGVTYSF
jgi:outer membrane cobalamin receptor